MTKHFLETVPSCLSCKYCINPNDTHNLRCNHPDLALTTFNVVLGTKETWTSCYGQRDDGGPCGITGIYWEPKK